MKVKAYHGTNRVFDAFDPSKQGTGVGASLICKGINLATSPEVADAYRKQVSTPDSSFTDKVYFTHDGQALTSLTQEIDFLIEQEASEDPDIAQNAIDQLEDIDIIREPSYGVVYEVSIPEREHLIQWEGCIENQPFDVVQVLRDLYGDDEIEEIYNEANEFCPFHISQNHFDDVFEQALISGTDSVMEDLVEVAPGYNWEKLEALIKQHCPQIQPSEEEAGRALYQSLSHSLGGEGNTAKLLRDYSIYGVCSHQEFTGFQGKNEVVVVWDKQDVEILKIMPPLESLDYEPEDYGERYGMGI